VAEIQIEGSEWRIETVGGPLNTEYAHCTKTGQFAPTVLFAPAVLLSSAVLKSGMAAGSLNWRIAPVLVFWVFVCGLANCWGQAYEVVGTITYRTFLAGQEQFGSRKEFKVSVKGCDWLIRAKDSDTGDSVEIGFENGVAYRLNSFAKANTNVLSALIEWEEVPNGDGSLTAYLWLAFASACHFAQITNKLLTPVWILDDPNLRHENFKMSAEWATADQPPHLPTRVTYFNDGIFRVYHPVKKERVSFRAQKPFDQGYVNATYEVLQRTNCGGLAVPTEFVFTRYAIPISARTNRQDSNLNVATNRSNLMVRSVVRVAGATVSPGSPATSFRPSFAATLTYMDQRFVRSNPGALNVLNTITNGNWPEITPELVRRAEITARAATSQRQPESGQSSRVRLVFGLVALGFPILVFFFLKKNKTATPP